MQAYRRPKTAAEVSPGSVAESPRALLRNLGEWGGDRGHRRHRNFLILLLLLLLRRSVFILFIRRCRIPRVNAAEAPTALVPDSLRPATAATAAAATAATAAASRRRCCCCRRRRQL